MNPRADFNEEQKPGLSRAPSAQWQQVFLSFLQEDPKKIHQALGRLDPREAYALHYDTTDSTTRWRGAHHLLVHACLMDAPLAVGALLDAGADANTPSGKFGNSPLMLTLKMGSERKEAIVAMLFEAGGRFLPADGNAALSVIKHAPNCEYLLPGLWRSNPEWFDPSSKTNSHLGVNALLQANASCVNLLSTLCPELFEPVVFFKALTLHQDGQAPQWMQPDFFLHSDSIESRLSTLTSEQGALLAEHFITSTSGRYQQESFKTQVSELFAALPKGSLDTLFWQGLADACEQKSTPLTQGAWLWTLAHVKQHGLSEALCPKSVSAGLHGQGPMHLATLAGKAQWAQGLFDAGIHFSTPNASGQTPVEWIGSLSLDPETLHLIEATTSLMLKNQAHERLGSVATATEDVSTSTLATRPTRVP